MDPGMITVDALTADNLHTFTREEMEQVMPNVSWDQEDAYWVVEKSQIDDMNWKAIDEQLNVPKEKDGQAKSQQLLLELDAHLTSWISSRIPKASSIDSTPGGFTLKLVQPEDTHRETMKAKKVARGFNKGTKDKKMGSRASKKRQANAESNDESPKCSRILRNSSSANVTVSSKSKPKPLYCLNAGDFKDKNTRMRVILAKKSKVFHIKRKEQMEHLASQNKKLEKENILLKKQIAELKRKSLNGN